MLQIIKQLFSASDIDEQIQLLASLSTQPSVDELVECVRYIQTCQAYLINQPHSLEIVGTGGSGLNRINTSTITCIMLAKKLTQSQYVLIKNGGRSASGQCGSVDLLEALGYTFPENNEALEESLKNHLAFINARMMYPLMGTVGAARKKYGKPTVFNLIGPLLCPARSELQCLGCSDLWMMKTLAEAAYQLGRKHVIVVRWRDGLDEITLTGPTDIVERNQDGIREHVIHPWDYGHSEVSFSEIAGGSPEINLKIAQDIIGNICHSEHKNLIDINIRVIEQFFWKYLYD